MIPKGQRAEILRTVAEQASPVMARIFRDIAAENEEGADRDGDWIGGVDGPAREPGEEG